MTSYTSQGPALQWLHARLLGGKTLHYSNEITAMPCHHQLLRFLLRSPLKQAIFFTLLLQRSEFWVPHLIHSLAPFRKADEFRKWLKSQKCGGRGIIRMKDLNNFVSRFFFWAPGGSLQSGTILERGAFCTFCFLLVLHQVRDVSRLRYERGSQRKNAHMASGVFGWLQRIEEGKF